MPTVTAARLTAHGEPLSVEAVDLQPPGDGEEVVSLLYAGLNPSDWHSANGRLAADSPLPRTPGVEASGRTAAGQLVVVTGAGLGWTRDGVFATHVVAPTAALIPVPEGVSPQAAAAVPIAGATAYHLVSRIAPTADDRVLVLGAGGGVGLTAVSLLAGSGIPVYGQVGTATKRDVVLAAGARDVAVGGADVIGPLIGEAGITAVIDPLGGAFTGAAFDALPPYGKYIVFGASAGGEVTLNWQTFYRKELRLFGYNGFNLTPAQQREGIENTLAAIADGRMQIPVQSIYALADVNEALGAFADRSTSGKLLLKLS